MLFKLCTLTPKSRLLSHAATSGYITKFGLAKQVTQAAEFKAMLDESLNKATKTKQWDIHLRYE